jgi:large subunit ribosomal protein L25
MLNTEVSEVTVKCKAIDIPESIDVDVSGLEVGQSLTVADLILPAGAVVAGDPSQVIARVLQGRRA